MAATPGQQRKAEELSAERPPSISELWVPGCQGVECEMSVFLSIATRALRPECVHALSNVTKQDRLASRITRSNDAAAAKGASNGESQTKTALWVPASSHHVVHTAGACVTTAAAAGERVASTAVSVLNQETSVFHAKPDSSGDGSSHASLVFLLVFCCIGFGVRHARKQQRLRSGYAVFGDTRAML